MSNNNHNKNNSNTKASIAGGGSGSSGRTFYKKGTGSGGGGVGDGGNNKNHNNNSKFIKGMNQKKKNSHHQEQQQQQQSPYAGSNNINNSSSSKTGNHDGLMIQQQQVQVQQQQKKKVDHTVFVRFVPVENHNKNNNNHNHHNTSLSLLLTQTLRRHHVEEFFSEMGPIKKVSLIHNNQNQNQNNTTDISVASAGGGACSSYGFIKYTNENDAELAAYQMNQRQFTIPTIMSSYSPKSSIHVKVQVELAKNVVSAGTTGTDSSTTKRSMFRTNNKKDNNHNIQEEEAETTPGTENDNHNDHDQDDIKKRNRFVIRNLSFYATEKDIRQVIEPLLRSNSNSSNNEIALLDVHIPTVTIRNENHKKVKTTHRGFAFITIPDSISKTKIQKLLQLGKSGCSTNTSTNTNNSSKDQDGGGIIIKNRQVTIEKALHKTAYVAKKEQQVQVQQSQVQKEEKAKHNINNNNSNDDDDDTSNADNNDSDDDDDNNTEQSDSDSNDDDSEADDSDDDDEEEDDDDDDHDLKKEKKVVDKNKQNQKEQKNHDVTAVQERRCLFVRNLPFDITRYELFELFRSYGYITSIYIVKDHQNVSSSSAGKKNNNNHGLPVGSAFLSFQTPEQASLVLSKSASTTSTADDGATTGNDKTDIDMVDGDGKDETTTTAPTSDTTGGGNDTGIVWKGRLLQIDRAVDKNTASTLSNASVIAGDKKLSGKIGLDRRNIYLLGEGRVENETTIDKHNTSTTFGAWDILPESDKFKRQAGWAEKHTKLKSPLFFINPYRLSIRNLAKNITELELKQLCCQGIIDGLQNKVITTQDQINHYRATGQYTTREILKLIQLAEEEQQQAQVQVQDRVIDSDMLLIPPFDVKNVKRYIPSVFLSRDQNTKKITSSSSSTTAPSKGFGFVEFTHHVHALACLRYLNNNVDYSALYVAGGKKLAHLSSNNQNTTTTKQKQKQQSEGTSDQYQGVRIPRLIVDFVVENKAKAVQQLEHRAQQQANNLKQQKEQQEKKQQPNTSNDQNKNNNNTGAAVTPIKKKSRGALQRERKRKEREGNSNDTTQVLVDQQQQQKNKKTLPKNDSNSRSMNHNNDMDDNDNEDDISDNDNTLQPILTGNNTDSLSNNNNNNNNNNNTKRGKKQKMDPDEDHFTKLVNAYKQQFSSTTTENSDKDHETIVNIPTTTTTTAPKKTKRWFE